MFFASFLEHLNLRLVVHPGQAPTLNDLKQLDQLSPGNRQKVKKMKTLTAFQLWFCAEIHILLHQHLCQESWYFHNHLSCTCNTHIWEEFDKLYFSLGLGCNCQYVNISPSLFPCHSVCESTKIPCHTITWTLHLSASLQRSRLCYIFLRWICEKVLHRNVCTTILQCDLPFSFEIGFINVKHT